MEKKVKLSVLGFSFNQTQSGTYGLVLAEEEGVRRLMIIVGTPEAQSIAFRLHNTEPPRPLTHDLFTSLMSDFGIFLKEVVIYKYDNGVFFSKLLFIGGNGEFVSIESRTSDAIAIAIRTGSPIYTTENIMQELAVVFSESDNETEEEISITSPVLEEQNKHNDYSLYNKDELIEMLSTAISDEDYELASVLRDEISKKEKEQRITEKK